MVKLKLPAISCGEKDIGTPLFPVYKRLSFGIDTKLNLSTFVGRRHLHFILLCIAQTHNAIMIGYCFGLNSNPTTFIVSISRYKMISAPEIATTKEFNRFIPYKVEGELAQYLAPKRPKDQFNFREGRAARGGSGKRTVAGGTMDVDDLHVRIIDQLEAFLALGISA